ncbi:MAG: hypothetical protein BWY22_01035 [Bacteroidetes bacterium ADurb.Bin217]|nr:MAG: hypothetical protein BWY22_01035 [Bacteroidetes bacterium ADurb.Bin217]
MKHLLILIAILILQISFTQAQSNCYVKEMAHIIDSIQKKNQ